MKRVVLAAFLLLAMTEVRAEEELPVAKERTYDPDVQEPGFGQDHDEEPRNLRIRIELTGLLAFWDADFRNGTAGRSNRMNLRDDLDVPRQTLAFRTNTVVKLHRFFAVGFEYFRLSAEGDTTVVKRDLRLGPVPTEIPPGSRAHATAELQQFMFSLRFVAADDAEIRAEFALGLMYVTFRAGVHPKPPVPLHAYGPGGDRLPGGGLFVGTSRKNDAWIAPTLGTFFVWNFHDRVGVYVDTTSGYVSFHPTFGSIASLNRAGFRFRIWQGLEVAIGVWIASGQTYDIRDRLPFVDSSHEFRQSSWIAGGPDLTIAFTY